MLVLCAGMYRACSTWQYEVVLELLRRRGEPWALGYQTGPEFAARTRPRLTTGTWAVVKSHERHPAYSDLCRNRRAVVVYAHRDVRDVAYSLMHKLGVDFAELLRRGMLHQVLANDRYWRARPRALVQRYDDLTADPAGGIRALAGFLGLALRPGEAEELAGRFSHEANRKRTERLAESLRRRGVDLADPANGLIYDAGSLLHWNHLRDGRTGGWRERATPAERYVLGRVASAWLSVNGYAPDPFDPATLPARERAALDRAICRGARAGLLREAALRHPRLGSAVKRALGMGPARAAVPVPHVPTVEAAVPAGRPIVPIATPDLDSRGRAG
jgi:hypothetical protein